MHIVNFKYMNVTVLSEMVSVYFIVGFGLYTNVVASPLYVNLQSRISSYGLSEFLCCVHLRKALSKISCKIHMINI